MKTKLLVDAKNLLWRAESAMGDLVTKNGIPTGATHGFLTMLLRVVVEHPADETIICWDDWKAGPRNRRAIYPGYKARTAEATEARKESTDRVWTQQKGLHALFRALGVRQARAPGWEADDVMGTLATRYGDTFRVNILTGDRDLLQCVTDNVSMLRPRQNGDITVMTPKLVHEEFGVLPKRFIDYKAIVGDPGDGYPGCPGIGEKGAAELLQKWGSLDQILTHLSLVKSFKPDHLKKLTAHVDLVRTCEKLATIETNAPLKWLTLKPSKKEALKLLHSWEMNKLLTQFHRLKALGGNRG